MTHIYSIQCRKIANIYKTHSKIGHNHFIQIIIEMTILIQTPLFCHFISMLNLNMVFI